MTKIFFDTEFTGLHQATTLISIGLVAETGETFYAELTDYDQSQVNDWLRDNVLAHLMLEPQNVVMDNGGATAQPTPQIADAQFYGSKAWVAKNLKEWLAQFGPVQMWSDCLAYDWVLFNDLLADYTNGYPQLPEGVHYIPMDICTQFQLKGVDPDVSRVEFAGDDVPAYAVSHNALWDALIIKLCHEKLTI